MANEIAFDSEPNQTFKAEILNASNYGQCYSGDSSDFGNISSYTDANWQATLLAVTNVQTGSSTKTSHYTLNFPTAIIVAGSYPVLIFSGANPSPSDVPVLTLMIDWSGSAVVSVAELATPDDFGTIGENVEDAKTAAESAKTNTDPLATMIAAGAFTEEAMGNVRSALGMASANLDTQLTVYFADIRLNRDSARQRDEYNIQWFKNGSPATLVEAGAITTPKITVISRAGVTLVSAQTLTEVGSGLGSYKYDATGTSRAASSDAVLVTVSATIGGSTRSFAKWVY